MVFNLGIDLIELILDCLDLRLQFFESGFESSFLRPQPMILLEEGRDIARRSASRHDVLLFVCPVVR